jgi:hypothetical protein
MACNIKGNSGIIYVQGNLFTNTGKVKLLQGKFNIFSYHIVQSSHFTNVACSQPDKMLVVFRQ